MSLNKELKVLYKKWPDQKRFLKTLGCTGPVAEDIFQEALLIYVRKQEEPSFELSVEPFHYVRKICMFLWKNEQRRQKIKITDIELEICQAESDWLQRELQFKGMEHALSNLGVQCQKMLQMFYGLGESMAKIAKKLELRNDKVAKTVKYRCLEKARALVIEMETNGKFEN